MNKGELVENMANASGISKAAAEKTKQDVETITIDEVMKLNNINKIDILKFDIQGGELMALQGAMNALQQKKISLIYTEALFVPHYENNPLLRDLWNCLEQYGYSLFDIYDMYRATNGQLVLKTDRSVLKAERLEAKQSPWNSRVFLTGSLRVSR